MSNKTNSAETKTPSTGTSAIAAAISQLHPTKRPTARIEDPNEMLRLEALREASRDDAERTDTTGTPESGQTLRDQPSAPTQYVTDDEHEQRIGEYIAAHKEEAQQAVTKQNEARRATIRKATVWMGIIAFAAIAIYMTRSFLHLQEENAMLHAKLDAGTKKEIENQAAPVDMGTHHIPSSDDDDWDQRKAATQKSDTASAVTTPAPTKLPTTPVVDKAAEEKAGDDLVMVGDGTGKDGIKYKKYTITAEDIELGTTLLGITKRHRFGKSEGKRLTALHKLNDGRTVTAANGKSRTISAEDPKGLDLIRVGETWFIPVP